VDKDLVGKVIHFYDKISVAIIKLDNALKTGSKVKFNHGENSFEQIVDSIQLEHEQIQEGKKGQKIAVKVEKEAKPGTLVYFVK
jgi:translation elongation factor EF-1alpha